MVIARPSRSSDFVRSEIEYQRVAAKVEKKRAEEKRLLFTLLLDELETLVLLQQNKLLHYCYNIH